MARQGKRRRTSESRALPLGPRPELARVFEETVGLYLRLSAIAATLYHRGEISGPRRTLLVALARLGPQTVASLARSRAQSRQRLQPLVDSLVDERLLVRRENPAHRRAYLVDLTPKGKAVVRHVLKREGALRAKLDLRISARRLADAAAVLRTVRHAIETQRLETRSRRALAHMRASRK